MTSDANDSGAPDRPATQQQPAVTSVDANNSFLSGNSELAALIRAHDWTATSLGPPSRWPATLKTAVRIMLASRQPFWIGWGPELVYLYNDAYKSIIGGKHPWALGQPTAIVWREIWRDIEPLLRTALSGTQGTYVEAQRLIMERNGYPEETYYTFSYSPIPDEGGRPGGIICANTDDTRRVVGERQVSLLRELGAQTANARALSAVCVRAAQALATNPFDLPFALIYVAEQNDPATFLLMGSSGAPVGHPVAPPSIDRAAASWPLHDAVSGHVVRVIEALDVPRAGEPWPTGGWTVPPARAAIVPFVTPGGSGRAGALVAGLNPFRLLDDSYQGFLMLAAGQLAASISAAEVFEQERRRAEALAELDKAKTLFFSNVSHELRTPLTLMLGPVAEVLESADLSSEHRERLEAARRNSQRLLKLVNSLLDFSRIEAGRIRARFEPTDLAGFTSELVSVFRSAIERAGMRLVVDCAPLKEPVYVDRDMWEKVVLNLLSNAFKYTLEGEIAVSLRQDAERAVLAVRDTGTGIPARELPHVFERFHRVAGARGRTQEGTGIGLSLVQELIKLHGGSVHVESVEGHGSTFTVCVPLGRAHLPTAHVVPDSASTVSATGAAAYVDEALRWIPDASGETATSVLHESPPVEDAVSPTRGARILLADDNADMREYVRRLLAPSWHIEAVADGEAALRAARRQPPDLIIADVMMPRLDGFGLLREIRDDQTLRHVPVVMLSARAGEEARIDGLAAGADDYLVKPFSSRELLARVRSQLEMAHLRREHDQQMRRVLDSMSDGVQIVDRDWRFTFMNAAARLILAEQGLDPDYLIGKHLWDDAFPDAARSTAADELRRVMSERTAAMFETYYPSWDRWFSVRAVPIEEGGIAVHFQDISQRKELEAQRQRLADEEAGLRRDAEALYELSRAIAGELDLRTVIQRVTDAATQVTGAAFGAFFYNVINDSGESYFLHTLSGAPREAFERFGMLRNAAVFAQTFEGTDVVRSDDIRNDPRYGRNAQHSMLQGHLPLVSYLAVPVRSRAGDVIGGLFFGHEQAAVFTERSERLAVSIAALAGVAFDNARLFETRCRT